MFLWHFSTPPPPSWPHDQNYDDIYDDIGGIYDSCDDYNYNDDSDPADDR
jgi:hypothetical protein